MYTFDHIIIHKIVILISLFILFSKYSSLKLGAPDDVPEYNDISWFVMLFACGLSNGVFAYSVYGPVHNYTERNRFSANPMLPDNQLAQLSIVQTMFHFGNLLVSIS